MDEDFKETFFDKSLEVIVGGVIYSFILANEAYIQMKRFYFKASGRKYHRTEDNVLPYDDYVSDE